jgi:hypothetical protein
MDDCFHNLNGIAELLYGNLSFPSVFLPRFVRGILILLSLFAMLLELAGSLLWMLPVLFQ